MRRKEDFSNLILFSEASVHCGINPIQCLFDFQTLISFKKYAYGHN